MVPIANIPTVGHPPRPYQQTATAVLQARIAAGYRRLLLVAPTGAGKTIIACLLICMALSMGQRVLFLAHRRELIGQASQRLFETGIDAVIIAPDFPARPG